MQPDVEAVPPCLARDWLLLSRACRSPTEGLANFCVVDNLTSAGVDGLNSSTAFDSALCYRCLPWACHSLPA